MGPVRGPGTRRPERGPPQSAREPQALRGGAEGPRDRDRVRGRSSWAQGSEGLAPAPGIGSLLSAQRRPRRMRMLRYKFQRTEVRMPRTVTAAVIGARTAFADWSDVGLGVGLGRSSPVGSPVPYGVPSGPPVVTGLASACPGLPGIPIARTARKLNMRANERMRA